MQNKKEVSIISIESIEFDDFAGYIEKSFNIRFDNYTFYEVSNVGEFMDVICTKVNAREIDSCVHQAVFYTLRQFTHSALNKDITPGSDLSKLFPQNNRNAFWKHLQKDLNIKLPALEPPVWFINFILMPLRVSILASIPLLFFNLYWGLLTLTSGFVLLRLSRYASVLLLGQYPDQNAGGLVKRIATTNYGLFNKGRFNKREVENILESGLLKLSGLDKHEFSRETLLVWNSQS